MDKLSVMIIASFLALLPAIFWFFLYRWLDRKELEPPKAMITAGVLGVISTIPIFGLQFIFKNFPEYNFIQSLQTNMVNPIVFSLVFCNFDIDVAPSVSALETSKFLKCE